MSAVGDARKRATGQTTPGLTERLRILHRPGADGQFCAHDGFAWPCTTARVVEECS